MINKDNLKLIQIKNIKPIESKDIKLIKQTYKFINEVTKAIENFQYNIAIASIRSLFNEINIFKCHSENCLIFKKFAITQLIKILYPICPHFCEESWEIIGNKKRLFEEQWPTVDEKYLLEENMIIPIQINGKKRSEIVVDIGISEKEIIKLAMSQPIVQKYVFTKPKKIIFIPKRILNIVI